MLHTSPDIACLLFLLFHNVVKNVHKILKEMLLQQCRIVTFYSDFLIFLITLALQMMGFCI